MTENKAISKQRILYHYCSVESFFQIIKSKTLWLSDAEYMNDSKEIIWIDEVVQKTIQELKKETDYKENALKLEVAYKKLKHEKNYIISFSEEEDLLSQWRGYADDSAGVAIGFDISLFKIPPRTRTVSQTTGKKANSDVVRLGYVQVNYEKNIIKNEITKLIEDVDFDSDISALLVKESAISTKHFSFQEEKEVRIIYTPDDNPQNQARYNISEKKFRCSNKQIIPYFEFSFDSEILASLISQVILGSKCKLKEKDLKDFLNSNGFENTIIQKSESSYI